MGKPTEPGEHNTQLLGALGYVRSTGVEASCSNMFKGVGFQGGVTKRFGGAHPCQSVGANFCLCKKVVAFGSSPILASDFVPTWCFGGAGVSIRRDGRRVKYSAMAAVSNRMEGIQVDGTKAELLLASKVRRGWHREDDKESK